MKTLSSSVAFQDEAGNVLANGSLVLTLPFGVDEIVAGGGQVVAVADHQPGRDREGPRNAANMGQRRAVAAGPVRAAALASTRILSGEQPASGPLVMTRIIGCNLQ